MAGFADPRVKEVRILGGCVCIEVHDARTLAGFQEFALARGVFSRPFCGIYMPWCRTLLKKTRF